MLHSHPKPTTDRLAQFGAAALLAVMLLAAGGQITLGLASGGPFAMLSFFLALVKLALALPVLMLTVIAPAVTVSPEGITLHPRVWRDRFVPWRDVRAVKPFPLLPPKDAEVTRRALEGRRRYQAAQGIMLVIPSLPIQFCVTGLFAGEGLKPVIALTNRAHTDYEQLVARVEQYAARDPLPSGSHGLALPGAVSSEASDGL